MENKPERNHLSRWVTKWLHGAEKEKAIQKEGLQVIVFYW
jgi:hypothetical protein